jgi:predicted metal-dependent phosphoesterase TrpH
MRKGGAMITKKVDLHTHTLASDGMNSPAQNVKMAKDLGLSAIAITDHDTVAGLEEALAAGKQYGIEVIPGVEISTVMNGQDIHILGYFIETKDQVFLDRLEKLRRIRTTRNEMIIDRLRELNIEITFQEVMEGLDSKSGDDTVGRPHIADVLIRKGIVRSMAEAFELYLGKHGKAFVNPPRITPFEAIQWIREAGGTAVIAHPGIYEDDEIVKAIISHGVDGIEAYHSDHTSEQEQKYHDLSQAHQLITTAGSDYHGERQGSVFHGPIGNRSITAEVIYLLKKNRK